MMTRPWPVLFLSFSLTCCAPSEESAAKIARPEGPLLRYEPASSTLTQIYGISEVESARRLNKEQFIGALSGRLSEGVFPDWSALWIQHEPTYAINISFKRLPRRNELLAIADPSIRKDIVLLKAKRNFQEIAQDNQRIIAALRSTQGAWSGGYDVKSEKFAYSFATPEAAKRALSAIPADLQPDVQLTVAPQPVSL